MHGVAVFDQKSGALASLFRDLLRSQIQDIIFYGGSEHNYWTVSREVKFTLTSLILTKALSVLK